jgi:hypothetical protein
MNINLHIERIILEGLPVERDGHGALQSAIETELTRLLSESGLAAGLRSGGALPNVPAGSIQLTGAETPAQIGQHIARAAYGSIGNE